MTGGAYSPSAGSVYRTLQLLVDEGAITERPDEDGTRKTYAVAARGKNELAEREAEARALLDRLADLAEERRPASTVQVNRAMGNRASIRLAPGRSGICREQVEEARTGRPRSPRPRSQIRWGTAG
jgi:DNA-binding PadR family transcriptional regulator